MRPIRRVLVRGVGALLVAGSLVGETSPAVAAVDGVVVEELPAEGANVSYIGNRSPLKPGPLIKLPVASFKPAGWLGRMLELQRDGLTGHLGEVSNWLTREGNAWLRTDGKGDYGWEEVPYWLRGFARIAYVLEDPRMLDEAKPWIEAILASQRPDGDFGPIIHRSRGRDLWGNMIVLQILQAWHEYSGDERVLPFMSRYFRWQLSLPDDRFLEDYWENSRGGDNLASVYWLYNRTGEAFLLELATKIDRNTADWRQKGNLPNWHVVNIAQSFREPATYFLQSGSTADLEASYHAFRLPRERFGQVPGGMFGADENAREGYTDPRQAAETCSFVEQIWSNILMSEITGDPLWAANTEDVAFNTMPAAFTPDYKALRYLTAPNLAVSDSKNHHPGVDNKGPFLLMNPFSSRCCQHNHTSGWINYAEHAWMATPDNGLAAILYAEGELRAKVGARGEEATLVTRTKYPFEEEVRITIQDAPTGGFPISLRIPAWAEGAAIRVNGEAVDVAAKPGAYVRLESEWKAGDTIELTLPMKVRVRTWEANKGSVSVDYGPLTFSLKIDEEYRRVASDETAIHDSRWQPGADPEKWPSFEILPRSPWNYALVLDGDDPASSFEVVRKPWPANNEPFTNEAAPIELRARGKIVPQWTLDEHDLAGVLPQSPVATDEPATDIALVPMGGARLRISAFPVAATP